MQHLWTPWRMGYVTGDDESNDAIERSRIFLDALERADDPDSLVVYRGQHAFIIMNLFPYNTGHMMVVPNRRVSTLDALEPEERAEMMELVSRATTVGSGVLACDGFNVGLNLGVHAGAGISEHLHIHVVPRWVGDANFMPITADTMVLPELLPATTARIRGEFLARFGSHLGNRPETTAGAIVFLPDSDKCVVRKAKDGTLVFPKGHIEKGETAWEAALREVEEETGFTATVTNWGGTETFALGSRDFHVIYFMAVGKPGSESESHLGTDTLLVNLDELDQALTFPSSQALARRAQTVFQRRRRQVID